MAPFRRPLASTFTDRMTVQQGGDCGVGSGPLRTPYCGWLDRARRALSNRRIGSPLDAWLGPSHGASTKQAVGTWTKHGAPVAWHRTLNTIIHAARVSINMGEHV